MVTGGSGLQAVWLGLGLTSSPFPFFGLSKIRSLSGAGRLYRVSYDDEVDVRSAQHFVNSSFSPVLLFRRRLKSVPDVKKGIWNHGFTQSRWEALPRFWNAVCRHGPPTPLGEVVPLPSLLSPLTCIVFYKWVFGSLDVFL